MTDMISLLFRSQQIAELISEQLAVTSTASEPLLSANDCRTESMAAAADNMQFATLKPC